MRTQASGNVAKKSLAVSSHYVWMSKCWCLASYTMLVLAPHRLAVPCFPQLRKHACPGEGHLAKTPM
eukprot:3118366-Pyramimonas_sp.AAC.1